MRKPIVASPQPGDRGLRRPAFQGAVRFKQNDLQPFMCQPVLPNERLVGGRVSGSLRFERMIQPLTAPDSWAEVALWYCPMSSYPEWMTRWMVTADMEDYAALGTGGNYALLASPASASQSIYTPGLHSRNRTWAGEIGSTTADGSSPDSRYVPVVSNGCYDIAKNWYEQEQEDQVPGRFENDDDWGENPPVVQQAIRGALPSGIDVDTGIDAPDGAATTAFVSSFAQWAESISLMTRMDMTYAEYLAMHGVNPRILNGISQPIAYRHIKQKPIMATTNVSAGILRGADGVDLGYAEGTSDTESWQADDIEGIYGASTDIHMVHDAGGLAVYGSEFSFDLPAMNFDEPGYVIGTVVWHRNQVLRGEFAEHMDAVHMTKFPHGGPGGFDELDFLSAAEYFGYDQDDLTDFDLQSSVAGTGATDVEARGTARAVNFLNLFMNGSTFTNAASTNSFDYRGLGGNRITNALQEFNMQVNGELGIASHLVNVS